MEVMELYGMGIEGLHSDYILAITFWPPLPGHGDGMFLRVCLRDSAINADRMSVSIVVRVYK